MSFQVGDIDDDLQIASLLQEQRCWSGYALCDLDPPWRDYARFVAAEENDHVLATVLFYAPPGITVIVPCGDRDGTAQILRQTDLPQRVFLSVRPIDMPAVEGRYTVSDRWTMLRMRADTGAFRRPGEPPPGLRRLTQEETADIKAMYSLDAGSFFWPQQLAHGIYFGVYDGAELVAIAGTHAVSERFRIAAIGGVYTRPAYRGRGLAKATTGAVAAALFEQGIEDVILNVAEENEPAIRAYRSLGFYTCEPFLEGNASIKRRTKEKTNGNGTTADSAQ